MPDQLPPEADRGLVWERVVKSAQVFHDHPKERGIASLISKDSGKSAQYVSDWKNGRSPIPMGTLSTLAALYGVSTGYLAGYTDDPAQTAPADKAAMRAKMVELVEQVVSQLNPNANPTLVIEMCDLAMDMLEEGESENETIGALFKKMRAADTKADAKARSEGGD